jgi:hypothetical protein
LNGALSIDTVTAATPSPAIFCAGDVRVAVVESIVELS